MKHSTLGTTLNAFGNVLEVIVIAGILALGVNIASTGLVAFFNWNPTATIVWGAALFLFGVALLLLRFRKALSFDIKIKAALCWSRAERRFIRVPGYRVAEKVMQYHKAAMVEDKDLEMVLNTEADRLKKKKDAMPMEAVNFNKFIREAIEYLIISNLSTHLIDFFNSRNKSVKFSEIDRAELSALVATNRLLYLFSKPIEERRVFSEDMIGPSFGEVVYPVGRKGVIFEKLNFEMPTGSHISRDPDGRIRVVTSGFTLVIQVSAEGYGEVMDSLFDRYVLRKKSSEVRWLGASISVRGEIHWKTLLFWYLQPRHMWLDGFIERLIAEADKREYLARIGWNASSVLLSALAPRNSEEKQEPSVKADLADKGPDAGSQV